MSKVYRIKDWHKNYEVNASGRPPKKENEPLRSGPLDYIRLKVFGKKLDSGYRRLLEVAGKAKAMMVFGYFVKFLDLAGDEEAQNRGGILRNERHEEASDEDLAFLLDLPIRQIRYATGVLANIGWMEIQEKDGVEVHADSLNSADAAKISDTSEEGIEKNNNLNIEMARGNQRDLRKQVVSSVSNPISISISTQISTSLKTQSHNFYESLISIIQPRSQSDTTCFRKVRWWAVYQIENNVFDEGLFSQILQIAHEAANKKTEAPRIFMGRLRKELGYDPKRLQVPRNEL